MLKKTMFRRMTASLITLCMIVSIISVGIVNVSADTSSDGEWIYGIDNFGRYNLTFYLGKETTVTLPEEIDGNKITSIDFSYSQYDQLGTLKNVIIPKSYEYIDFSDSDIETVICSREYTEPKMELSDFGSFNRCKKLKKVVLPNLVNNNCITPELFYDVSTNTYLDNYSLNGHTFENCVSLEEVVLPDNIVEIGYSCFKNCNSLESLTIPDGVQYIYDQTFFGCSSLTTLKFPGTLKEWTLAGLPLDGSCTILVPFNSFVGESIKEKTYFEFINSETGESIELGDVDGDGRLSVVDVTVMQKKLAGLYNFDIYNYDINEDGNFNINDATYLQKKLARLV